MSIVLASSCDEMATPCSLFPLPATRPVSGDRVNSPPRRRVRATKTTHGEGRGDHEPNAPVVTRKVNLSFSDGLAKSFGRERAEKAVAADG